MESRIAYGQGQLNVEREIYLANYATICGSCDVSGPQQLMTMLSLNERGYFSFHKSNMCTLSPFHNP